MNSKHIGADMNFVSTAEIAVMGAKKSLRNYLQERN
jgi:acetyl-CoA carboxylase carboxyltransferase component